MKHRKVYLDYAATTPVDPRVARAMAPYLYKKYGNTMSLHRFGLEGSEAVERARETVARYIKAQSEEIIFTSSATESNNLALKGVAWANRKKGKHLIISAIEHDCVRESAKWLQKEGWEVTSIGVDRYGLIKFEELEKAISPKTAVVSVIHGNNEVGTIQNIKKIGELCRSRGVYFHSDAAQSLGKVPIDVGTMRIDLLTASSHKIYGPKGAAILYIRGGVEIEPLLHGGGHEGGLRSATVNVPAIVGMAKAVEILKKEGRGENKRMMRLRNKMIRGILGSVKGTRLNGPVKERLANSVNISFALIEGESLLLELDRHGVMCSTGSACSSRALEPSHVLTAMGLSHAEAHGSLRFSLGRWTKETDIDYLLEVLPEAVKKLREISPFKNLN
jgi:cysteine desulfurase